jgi:hypothetical protein
VGQSSGSDHEVVGTDALARRNELRPDLCMYAGYSEVERQDWQHIQGGVQECLSLVALAGGIRAEQSEYQL